jgi:hypothetical protein
MVTIRDPANEAVIFSNEIQMVAAWHYMQPAIGVRTSVELF